LQLLNFYFFDTHFKAPQFLNGKKALLQKVMFCRQPGTEQAMTPTTPMTEQKSVPIYNHPADPSPQMSHQHPPQYQTQGNGTTKTHHNFIQYMQH